MCCWAAKNANKNVPIEYECLEIHSHLRFTWILKEIYTFRNNIHLRLRDLLLRVWDWMILVLPFGMLDRSRLFSLFCPVTVSCCLRYKVENTFTEFSYIAITFLSTLWVIVEKIQQKGYRRWTAIRILPEHMNKQNVVWYMILEEETQIDAGEEKYLHHYQKHTLELKYPYPQIKWLSLTEHKY